MNTKLLHSSKDGILLAADILKNGGLVAIPTETVYGLAANAKDPIAVKNIFTAKGRAQDNPLIVHIADIADLPPLVKNIPDIVYKLAERFWPGPLTMIMEKSDIIPDAVTCGCDTVAIRIPQNPVAREIIKSSGVPLAAPSANISGGVSPVTARHCFRDLKGKIDAIVDGGDCKVGIESTVLLCTTNPPRLLRPGFVTPEQIEAVIGHIEIDEAVLNPLEKGVKPASPGMKYKHYSPKANVILVQADNSEYIRFVNGIVGENIFALCFDEEISKIRIPCLTYGSKSDSKEQAAELFSILRLLDYRGAKVIYAHMPPEKGVGLAVKNRLLRSAGFNVIEVS